jgi:hypothetical protein
MKRLRTVEESRREREQLLLAHRVLTIEKSLAIAHQAVYHAVQTASTFSDLRLHDDLQLLLLELERFQEDLLRGHRRDPLIAPHRAYLRSSPRDDGRPAS